MFPGDDSKPSFPLNLLADFGGGGMTCALGILLAIIERQSSEAGQVVSTNMVSTSSPSSHRAPHTESCIGFGNAIPLNLPTHASHDVLYPTQH